MNDNDRKQIVDLADRMVTWRGEVDDAFDMIREAGELLPELTRDRQMLLCCAVRGLTERVIIDGYVKRN